MCSEWCLSRSTPKDLYHKVVGHPTCPGGRKVLYVGQSDYASEGSPSLLLLSLGLLILLWALTFIGPFVAFFLACTILKVENDPALTNICTHQSGIP